MARSYRSFIWVGALLTAAFFFASTHRSQLQNAATGAISGYKNTVHDPEAGYVSESAAVQHSAVDATKNATSGKRKVIVTSVQREDETSANWVADMLPDWDTFVYVTDRRSDEEPDTNDRTLVQDSVPVNVGREASVYLTWIIQHYYSLPDVAVFIHGKRYQYHNDEPMLDTFPLIQRLNIDYVQEQGYLSLKCNWGHCPKPQVEPVLGYEDGYWDIKNFYAEAFALFFPNETIPTEVTGPCCAQFAVSKETIHRWPVAKYEHIRQWVWAQEGAGVYKSGLVLEYMWHIIFGKPAMYCPPAKECYCKTWGLCNLDCEREGWCRGRTWLNPEKWIPYFPAPLPSGWPEHGQGVKGEGGEFPYDGWWNDPEEVVLH